MERYLDEDEEYEDEEFTEQDQDRLDLQEFAKKSISMKTEAKDHFSGLFMMFMVKNHPEQVIDYCTAMGRAKELEDYIALNPSLACQYAEEVIKGRWEEAEDKIASSDCAYYYARAIIKGRFPAYEKTVKGTSDLYDKVIRYCVQIGKRWPEMEERIAKKASLSGMMEYVRHCIKGRFEAAEERIMTKPNWIMEYCNTLEYCDTLGGKPPKELHTAMTMFSFQEPDNKTIKSYFNKYGK